MFLLCLFFYILKSYFETNTYNKIIFIFYLKENYPKKVKEKKSIDKKVTTYSNNGYLEITHQFGNPPTKHGTSMLMRQG